MPLKMPERDNPAGRLYRNMRAIKNCMHVHAGGGSIESVATELNLLDKSSFSLVAVIGDLRDEVNELQKLVDEVKSENPFKYDLWNQILVSVNASLATFTCNLDQKICGFAIDEDSLNDLQLIAVDLPVEETVPPDELEKIRQLCDDMRKEVLASTTFSKLLKIWLLDLISLMQEGIDKYRIRGSRGLRKRFREMVGTLATNPEYMEQVKKEDPSLWEKLAKGFDWMKNVSEAIR